MFCSVPQEEDSKMRLEYRNFITSDRSEGSRIGQSYNKDFSGSLIPDPQMGMMGMDL
jgi:hypothetical protein